MWCDTGRLTPFGVRMYEGTRLSYTLPKLHLGDIAIVVAAMFSERTDAQHLLQNTVLNAVCTSDLVILYLTQQSMASYIRYVCRTPWCCSGMKPVCLITYVSK